MKIRAVGTWSIRSEQFHGRRVHPVQVFDDQEHGLLLRRAPTRARSVSRVSCRCCSGGSAGQDSARRQRQRQERGHQGTVSAAGTPAPGVSELLERGARRLPVATGASAEELGDGIPGSVLVVGQPRHSRYVWTSLAMWSFSACTRRDFPMPASPASTTTWPMPALTRAQRSTSSPTSGTRPTSGSARGRPRLPDDSAARWAPGPGTAAEAAPGWGAERLLPNASQVK